MSSGGFLQRLTSTLVDGGGLGPPGLRGAMVVAFVPGGIASGWGGRFRGPVWSFATAPLPAKLGSRGRTKQVEGRERMRRPRGEDDGGSGEDFRCGDEDAGAARRVTFG